LTKPVKSVLPINPHQWRKRRHEKKKLLMAGVIRAKQLFLCSSILSSNNNKVLSRLPRRSINVIAGNLNSSETKKKEKEKRKRRKEIEVEKATAEAVVNKEKRRTRSSREYELADGDEVPSSHVPVMLGEVLDIFSSVRLRSFVDCTLGAAGHSSSVSFFFIVD